MALKFIDTDIRKKGGEIAKLSFYLEDCLAKRDIFVTSKIMDEFAEKCLKENKKE
ncbi:MAG: hypothetical protein V1854_03620 [Methanobacteriota archaeon]